MSESSGRARRAVRFLVVGGAAFVVDAGIFNLLVHGPDGGVLHDRPISAKVLATGLSTLVSFYGNKLWAFEREVHGPVVRQTVAFVLVNVVAWILTLAPLAASRYLLGLDSALADNVSGNLIGVVLALIFRFWAYGRFVFPELSVGPPATADLSGRPATRAS